MAIPYAVTKSVCFFAVASGLLAAAYCSCLLGNCSKHNRGLFTFASGVVFVISGLVMLFGLIMYIAVFKAEIGGKLRPKSHVQPPAFIYRYGYSFLLYVCGFIGTQLSGISSIFLFIYKMQFDYTSKHLDDLRRGHKLLRPPSNINYVPFDHHCGGIGGIGGIGGGSSSSSFLCRRHPQSYVNSNSLMHMPSNYASATSPTTAAHQRRYFFGKDGAAESSDASCNVHLSGQRMDANSIKESPSFYDFPPPPTISYQFDERGQFRDGGIRAGEMMRTFPRDSTANTISTTADVVVDEFVMPERFEDYGVPGSHPAHHQEFVTFDLDQPLPLRTQSTVSINSRNGGSRKDFANDSLRRTTPV